MSAADILRAPSASGHLARFGKPLPPEVVVEMNGIVRTMARKLHARLPLNCGVEINDLVQAGNIGLLQAARNFKPERGAPLRGYARFRIRGEMLELIRRSAQSARQLAPMPEMENLSDRSFWLDESSDASPQTRFVSAQRSRIVGEEIGRLPPRQRMVLKLRYAAEMTLTEIGRVLNVNESRACQLHRNALRRLRRALRLRGVQEACHI